MTIPRQAYDVQVAFLPPMSGLSSNETRLDAGAINVRLGEGRTAEVLRNLCYSLASSADRSSQWDLVVCRIRDLFRVELKLPEYIPERGEVQMRIPAKANTNSGGNANGIPGRRRTVLGA